MDSKKVLVKYPCRWSYRIIGENKDKMLDAVNKVLAPKAFTLSYSNTSKNGKYLSINIELEVKDETERNYYFKLLADHCDIRMVL